MLLSDVGSFVRTAWLERDATVLEYKTVPNRGGVPR
jgi:hypothetical protein